MTLSSRIWPDALDEYAAMFDARCAAFPPELPPWSRERLDYFGYRRFARMSAAEVDTLAEALGLPIPLPLRTLWQSYGTFSVLHTECRESIELFSLERIRTMGERNSGWPNLFEVLCTFGARWEFEQALDPQQVEVLRSSYAAFGIVRRSDSDFELLVFDRHGNVGLVNYNHDWAHFNGAAWSDEFHGLASGKLRVVDLNEILAARIDACRQQLEEWEDGA
jgi:hypothetical protein